MALSYNFEKVKDHETIIWDEDDTMRPKAQAIIFMTMFTGINEITEDNVDEFYARVSLIEKLDGAHTYKVVDGKREDDPMTPEEVQKFIGLHTNASPLTRAAFLSKITNQLSGDLNARVRDYKREMEKAQAAA